MYKNLPAARARAAISLSVRACAAACLVLAATSQSALAQPTSAPKSAPLQAAWVYMSVVPPAGWTRQHDQARLQAERALGGRVQTSAVPDVPENAADAERVLRW